MSVSEMRQKSIVGRNTEIELIGVSCGDSTRYYDSDLYKANAFYSARECAKFTFEERGGSRLLWEDKTHVGV
jgi:hypothetical protein